MASSIFNFGPKFWTLLPDTIKNMTTFGSDCFALDINITDYYVMHICNLEQFENKVTYLSYLGPQHYLEY